MKFLLSVGFVLAVAATAAAQEKKEEPKKTVVVGSNAPVFKIKGADGKEVDLAALTEKGPVLVRLTCGCSGCDKELDYFAALNEAYKGKGLTTLAIFKEPQDKMPEYAKKRNLQMLYAVDSEGASWKTFEATAMPTNVLIEKGGKIVSIAAGCDPSGLLANRLSEKTASILKTEKVDVKEQVETKKK